MKNERKVIDDFMFEEVYLLTTFMRSDNKKRILEQLDEMNSDDEEMLKLIANVKEKISKMTREELNELMTDLPPNEFDAYGREE